MQMTEKTDKKKNVNNTIFDDFPTTLSAMGAQIESDRLGLGTNLFSAKETLSEKEGVTAEYNKMLKKSKLMENYQILMKKNIEEKKKKKCLRQQMLKLKKQAKIIKC